MKKLKIIIFSLVFIQLFLLFSEVKSEPIFFLTSYDSIVLESLESKIKELGIRKWKVKHYNENKEKISDLTIEFDKNENKVQISFFNKKIKNPLTKYYSYDENNGLVREEILYEAAAPYLGIRNISVFRRSYDTNNRIIKIECARFSGYTKEVPIEKVKYLNFIENYSYDEDGKIKEIEYDPLRNYKYINKYFYYDSGKIKEIKYFTNNNLDKSEKYNEMGKIEYINDKGYKYYYVYNNNGNLIEYKSIFKDPNSSQLRETTFNKYDENNNLIESINTSYTIKGRVVTKTAIYNKYNEQNQLIEEKKYLSDRFFFHKKHEYDAKGNIIKTMNFNKKEKYILVDLFSYEYDEDGLLTKKTIKHGNPKYPKTLKMSYSTYEYVKKKK